MDSSCGGTLAGAGVSGGSTYSQRQPVSTPPCPAVPAGFEEAGPGGVPAPAGAGRGGHCSLSKCTMKPAMASCVPMSAAA